MLDGFRGTLRKVFRLRIDTTRSLRQSAQFDDSADAPSSVVEFESTTYADSSQGIGGRLRNSLELYKLRQLLSKSPLQRKVLQRFPAPQTQEGRIRLSERNRISL